MIKTSLFCLLITGLLFSCNLNNNQNNNIYKSDFKKFDTSISFSGHWLSENYYNDILKNKSPRKSQMGSQFITIPDKTLKDVIVIYNFHEGRSNLCILKNGNHYELWERNNDSIIKNEANIEIISINKIKIGNDYFVKINPIENKTNPLILEEILFKGNYISDKGVKVEFTNDGKIKGLSDFKFYYPLIDYFDAGLQVDQVELGINEKDIVRYGFKFNNDTLKIYDLFCVTNDPTTNTCLDVKFGKLKFELIKK